MQSMCADTLLRKLVNTLAGTVMLYTSLGCGRQVGYVGRENANAVDAGGDVFWSDFPSSDDQWTIDAVLPRASVNLGRPNALAADNRVAELLFPGNPSLGPMDDAGPEFVTQLATVRRFHFGTLRTKVSFGACDRLESVMQAVLGYFNDGTDSNGNGLVDDLEIDFQVGCESPNVALLSVFTDYQESANGTQFRKLSRIIDFATGEVFDTMADDASDFTPSGTDATLVRPQLMGLDSFHEIGFDWQPDSIRFFIVDGAEELTLWTLNGADHVPQQPIYLMYNLWHPSSHWFPLDGAADFPANDVVMKLDWVRY